MNWAALAAMASLLGVLATIIGVAYTSGKLTQRISDNDDQIKIHARRLDDHAERLGLQDVKIGKIEEWKSGVRLGVHIGAGTKEDS